MKLASSLSVKRTRSGSTASEIPTMPHLPGEEPAASASMPKPAPSTATRPRQKRGGGRKTAQVTDLGGSGDVDEGDITMSLFASEILTVRDSPPAKATEQSKRWVFYASRCTPPTCVHHQESQAAMKGEEAATTTPKLTPDQQVILVSITTRTHTLSPSSRYTPRGVYQTI